jgi:uroporphyrinogen-III decarboxylase
VNESHLSRLGAAQETAPGPLTAAPGTPRRRFLDFVRRPRQHRPPVSPFLPKPDVVESTLRLLGLPVCGDAVLDEIALALALDYEPMFMVGCTQFIFPWALDEEASDEHTALYTLPTSAGTWARRLPRGLGLGSCESSFPVQSAQDHAYFQAACRDLEGREAQMRDFFRQWRAKVGDAGVIVIGHVNPYWLAQQVGQATLFLHWHDLEETYRESMRAVYEASLRIFAVAMEEGFDFMSASGLGLEMTSPELFAAMDVPCLRDYARWTHERGGLFWYHNCGRTRRFFGEGTFDLFEADVIETVAPPPAGDNDLAQARKHLRPASCTKGNLDLGLLRLGKPEEVEAATRAMVAATRDTPHVHSTADAVLPGTPPENFLAFLRTARQLCP